MPDREQIRTKILDGLRHCMPETEDDAHLGCQTCPYNSCYATVSLPIQMVEQMRILLQEQPKECKSCGIVFDIAYKAGKESIVRCKDCRYWQDNNNGYPHPDCRWGHDETPDPDDYCSFGERKEGL